MPFTISHAGFVVPFKGLFSPHVLVGLLIGSIVPDFPYFIRAFGCASFAHTVAGALCVCLPIGAVLYVLLRKYLRWMAMILPKPHSDFFMNWEINQSDANPHWLIVMVAIFAGALSHNFVDSFTHESGRAVMMFPILSKEVLFFHGLSLHAYRILQYGGSVLGLAILATSYWLELSRHCQTTSTKLWQDPRHWLVLIMTICLTGLTAALLNSEFIPTTFDFFDLRVFVFKFLITWIPLTGVCFLGLAVLRAKLTATIRTTSHSSTLP
jgi:hypothetical protein